MLVLVFARASLLIPLFFSFFFEYCVLFSLNFYGNSLDVFSSQKRLIRASVGHFLCV